VVTLAFGFYFI